MFLQFEIGILKDLTGFVSDQVIADIVFVFEIQIKSSFCHTGVFYDTEIEVLLNPLSIKREKAESSRDSFFVACYDRLFPYRDQPPFCVCFA